MTNQSPAPVAGAVEALMQEVGAYGLQCATTGELAPKRSLVEAANRLAALHPQPAPAVAVEAVSDLLERIRELADAWNTADMSSEIFAFNTSRLFSEHDSGALAARSAPAVAESQWRTIETAPREGMGVLNIPESPTVGSGSAQEGQAK